MRPFLLSLMISSLIDVTLRVTLTSPEARPNYEPEPLILSAVLIVKYSLSSLSALRSTSLKLKLKSYFLQFVLCQYVKDLVDYKVRGEIPESNRDYNRFSFLYLNSFAYKKPGFKRT